MGAKLGGGGGRYDVNQNADINVTPFVDVMLVLLIIFMVSAPLATVSIKLDLPPSIPNTIKPDKLPTVINIQKSGAIFVGDKETTVPQVGSDVYAAIGGANPRTESVYIRGDKEVRYSLFMAVVNALQTDGFFKVSLITEDRI